LETVSNEVSKLVKEKTKIVRVNMLEALLDEKSSTGYSLRKGFCFSVDHVLQRTNLNGNYTPVSLAMENPAFLPGKTVFLPWRFISLTGARWWFQICFYFHPYLGFHDPT